MPIKTGLTVLTFVGLILLPAIAPALKNYKSLDPRDLPSILDFPLKKRPGDLDTNPIPIEELRAKRLEATAPKNLIDPGHTMDGFYRSLLQGGVTNIIHYGDSPTTADLITADARAMLQKQFGDAGSGFVLIARPWAWYNHRGVEMDASSQWKIDIAGIAQAKDGMHGLGGVSFLGSPGATAHWRLRGGSHSIIEIAYLAQPDGGEFAVDADDRQLGVVETASEAKLAAYAPFPIPTGATRFTLRVTR